VLLLARTDAGYANLCRLITLAHMSGERGEPSLTAGEVLRRSGGRATLGSTALRELRDAARSGMSQCRDRLLPITYESV